MISICACEAYFGVSIESTPKLTHAHHHRGDQQLGQHALDGSPERREIDVVGGGRELGAHDGWALRADVSGVDWLALDPWEVRFF